MADILATVALDPKEFRRGLAQVQRDADSGAAKISKSLSGLGGFARGMVSFAMLKKGLEQIGHASEVYRKETLEGAAAARTWGREHQTNMVRIGAEVEQVLEQIGLSYDSLKAKASGSAVAFIKAFRSGVLGGGDAAGLIEYEAAMDERVESQKAAMRTRRQGFTDLAFGAESNEAAGNTIAAARFREALRHKERLQALDAEHDQQTRDRLIAQENHVHQLKLKNLAQQEQERQASFKREMDQVEASQYLASVRNAGDERKAAVLAAKMPFDAQAAQTEADLSLDPLERRQRSGTLRRKGDEAGRLAGEAFDREQGEKAGDFLQAANFRRQREELDALETEGMKAAADLGRIRLEAEMEIAEVREASYLSAIQKEEAIAQIGQSRDRLLRGRAAELVTDADKELKSARRGVNFREVAAGIGGAVVGSGHWYGGGDSREMDEVVRAQQKQAEAVQSQTEVLREIRNQLRDGIVGVVG